MAAVNTIIQDLKYLHSESGLVIEDTDEDIMLFLARESNPKEVMIREKRIELFVAYINEVLVVAEKNIRKLRWSFADISSLNDGLSECLEKFFELKNSVEKANRNTKKNLQSCQKIFKTANRLDNNVINNGPVLASRGRMQFMNLFLVFAGLTTLVYGWCIVDYIRSHLVSVLTGWIVVLALTWILIGLIKLYILRPPNLK